MVDGRVTGFVVVVADFVVGAAVIFEVVVGVTVVLVVSAVVLAVAVVMTATVTEVVVESSEVVLNSAIISARNILSQTAGPCLLCWVRRKICRVCRIRIGGSVYW